MELVQNVITMVIILIAIHLNLKIIPALGHSWGSNYYTYQLVDDTYHLKMISQKCSRCGQVSSSTYGQERHSYKYPGYGPSNLEVCTICGYSHYK